MSGNIPVIDESLKSPPDKNAAVSKSVASKAQVQNSKITGLRGNNDENLIVQSDGSPPWLKARSNGTVYIAAGVSVGAQTADQITVCDTSYKQYAKEAKLFVAGQRKVHVKSQSKVVTNSNLNESIVGNSLLNVGGSQNTIAGAGQQIDIAGDNTVDVSVNIVETVNGNEDKRTKAGFSNVTNGTAEELILGGFLKTKASTELSVTFATKVNLAASGEISTTVGATEAITFGGDVTVELAAVFGNVFCTQYENVSGVKLEITAYRNKKSASSSEDSSTTETNAGIIQEEAALDSDQGKTKAG